MSHVAGALQLNGASFDLYDADAIPDDEAAFCERLWATRWPDPPYGAEDPDYSLNRIFYVIAQVDGHRVGACCVLRRTIWVDGRSHTIAGLSDVLLLEAYRLRGIGSAMVRLAMAEAAQRGYPWGMLFCLTQRAYYERLGWHALRGTVTMTQYDEQAPTKPGDHVMVIPLSDDAEAALSDWLAATIQIGVGQW